MTGKLVFSTLVLTYILMVFGGIVTSTGSGLGCPDWPLCHGQLLPFQIKEEIPTPPAPYVAQTHLQPWIEQTHRILGGLVGILLIASLVSVWRNFQGFPRKGILWIFLLLIFEALLGMRVVVTEAPLLREFLDYVYTTSHLILSVMILSGLTFIWVSVTGRDDYVKVPHSEALYLLVMFQILLGILVRYVKAPDYNLFSYLLHITVAMGLIIFSLYLLLKAPNGQTFITLILVSLQVVAGVATVLTKIYLPVLFFHILFGFLLVFWVSYLVAPKVLEGKTIVRISSPREAQAW
jgi:cytochrome c oxidase assembly protein subunit 15